MTHSGVLAGLTVGSDFELPGVAPAPAFSPDRASGAFPAADVVVVRGIVPQALPQATIVGPTMQIASRSLLLSIPKVARFLVENGESITVEMEEGVPDSEVGIFLIGTVLGMLLHQRGCVVLHASAVEVNGGAVLFCGVSGAGKSTLAAALNKRGYGFISDDVCAIDQADGRSVVMADCRRLKLWGDAIKVLGLEERKQHAVRSSIEKYYVAPQKPTRSETFPVREIYFLRKTMSDECVALTPLGHLDALTHIRLNAYRPRLHSALAIDQGYLNQSAALVRQAKAFSMRREWGLRKIEDAIAALESNWKA